MRPSNAIPFRPFRRKISATSQPAFFVAKSRHLRSAMSVALPFYLSRRSLGALLAVNLILAAAYFSHAAPSFPMAFAFLGSSLSNPESFSQASPEMTAELSSSAAQLSAKDQRAAAFIAKRYRIAREAANIIVAEAVRAGEEHKIDPYLLLALIARESSFNPFAESSVGALGLTQNLPEAHPEKISTLSDQGGHILDVSDNIRLGAQVLREYLARFNGNETLALQQYNGALADPSRSYSKAILRLRAQMLSSIR